MIRRDPEEEEEEARSKVTPLSLLNCWRSVLVVEGRREREGDKRLIRVSLVNQFFFIHHPVLDERDFGGKV
jgi:hypothetical protein